MGGCRDDTESVSEDFGDQGDLVINFTPTGMVPTKELTPHVPASPTEIVDSIHEAWEMGISMVHLHARDEDGVPSSEPEHYGEIIRSIRKFAPDLVVCVSLSGRLVKSIQQRAAPLRLDGDAKPDMGSLTLSSLNFPQQSSENSPDAVKGLAMMMQRHGVLPELEAFDTGMLNYARYLERKGYLNGPHYVNLIMGNIASAQADLLHAGMLVNELPEQCLWAFGGIGATQLRANTLGIAMGGGVRVGLEDNIFLDEGKTRLATNAELLERIHAIAAQFSRKCMPASVLRERLQLQRGFGEYGRKVELKKTVTA